MSSRFGIINSHVALSPSNCVRWLRTDFLIAATVPVKEQQKKVERLHLDQRGGLQQVCRAIACYLPRLLKPQGEEAEQKHMWPGSDFTPQSRVRSVSIFLQFWVVLWTQRPEAHWHHHKHDMNLSRLSGMQPKIFPEICHGKRLFSNPQHCKSSLWNN